MTMIIAFTGIRALHPDSKADVERFVIDHSMRAKEIRFGGALGVDTVGLRAIARYPELLPRVVVYVPWTVADQPRAAAYCIQQTGVRVVELDQPKRDMRAELLRRNDTMIHGIDWLGGCWDGRRGGTQYTIERARRKRIAVELILVKGDRPQKLTGSEPDQ